MVCCIFIVVIEVIEDVLKILPEDISNVLKNIQDKEKITELRLRVGTKLRAYFGRNEQEFMMSIEKGHLLKILSNISSNSIYSVQNDINKGFITISGGNRIGIAGEVVILDGKIKNIKDISSMNIRIAHECLEAASKIMDKIVVNGRVNNTLIVSSPGLGKTTLLRDVVRNLSVMGYNVSVIDERGEIAAMYDGRPSLNVGHRTDVISFVDKVQGIEMAVRSMAPQVICTDEIGSEQDVEAIKYLCKCGVKFITTMHGGCLEDIIKGPMRSILNDGYLDTVIVLSNKFEVGSIDKVYTNLSCINQKEEVIC